MNRPRFIALALALATVLLYLPCCWHEFIVYDDGDYVSENGIVRAGLTWTGFKWAFGAWHFANWHPLTWLSHMVDCQLFGMNAGLHHLVNILFHAANTVLLFYLLLQLTKTILPSVVMSAIFAWHPLHVESVAWIAERKDVLSTFFGLIALIFYVRYAGKKHQTRTAHLDYWMAFGFFACSLLSKPMLVTLPCVMLLLDYWPIKRVTAASGIVGHPVREKIPFFLLSIASCVITYFAQREEAVVSLVKFPFSMRIGNAVLSYGRYLLKIFYPTDLSPIYPLPTHVQWAAVVLAGTALAFVSGVVWWFRKRTPWLPVGWLLFLGTLVPVIGLVRVGSTAMADRYSYFPSIGISFMIGYGAWRWATHFSNGIKIYSMTASVFVTVCAFLTVSQIRYWETSETLFTHAIDVTENNSGAQNNLALALQKANRPLDAITHYRESIRIRPAQAGAHNNLANLLWEVGQKDEASEEYRAALQVNPNLPKTHSTYGQLLAELGEWKEAMQEYEASLRLDPHNLSVRILMAEALLAEGRDKDTINYFREVLAVNPDDVSVLTRLAQVLAANENVDVRNGAEAVILAERANHFTSGQDPYVLNVLAMAYAETGRFEDAINTCQRVIDIAANLDDTEAVKILRERLQLYKAGKAYREKFDR